ncbi:J domain-containing protein [Metallibacterium scheffleri]|uniref:J domain-containing protein n=1 Tax=Metallibacterium scheffleri TaxID=993689 RepID=A0A4S3KLT6_9GAMM|nr:hypothetical protein B1806_10020 [Metallibacterium scheffleri]
MRVHTHYDNLKVARDASPEVIRAAYLVLVDRYSPRRYPESTEAARVLKLVNMAYEVLSNPERRTQHDLWIHEQERGSAPDAEFSRQPGTVLVPKLAWWFQLASKVSAAGAYLRRRWSLFLLAAIAVGVWVTYEPQPTQMEPAKPYVQDLVVAPASGTSDTPQVEHTGQERAAQTPVPAASYVRPSHAPNGAPWPNAAGYVDGYKHLHINGLSTVTIDNGQNTADVFVKLVSLGGNTERPVRAFYIPAHGIFTLTHITAGSYDIRYDDLSNGSLWRTDPFELQETPEDDGTQFSKITMTLYKVPNGNMQIHPISASQF